MAARKNGSLGAQELIKFIEVEFPSPIEQAISKLGRKRDRPAWSDKFRAFKSIVNSAARYYTTIHGPVFGAKPRFFSAKDRTDAAEMLVSKHNKTIDEIRAKYQREVRENLKKARETKARKSRVREGKAPKVTWVKTAEGYASKDGRIHIKRSERIHSRQHGKRRTHTKVVSWPAYLDGDYILGTGMPARPLSASKRKAAIELEKKKLRG